MPKAAEIVNAEVARRIGRRADLIKPALDRGLGKWVIRAHRESIRLLSGSNADPAGAYPVPVRKGHLRRSEDYILPGTSKHGMRARSGQGFLVNTATYATVIHKDRRFQADAVQNTRKAGLRDMRAALHAAVALT